MRRYTVRSTAVRKFFLINPFLAESANGIVNAKRMPHHFLVNGMKMLLVQSLQLNAARKRHSPRLLQ